MESSGFMEDFGQKVDLTQRIREVLLHYPEGTTILKELIQNADDAGATLLRFCIDSRHHGTSSLISPALQQFQGPALLSSNNVPFTDEDFESISRIGQSVKQNQSGKTGRFGIGFNSVYHLSELPSFVSRNYVVFFDPQCKFLPAVSSSNPGKRIDFVRSLALKHYEDQFTPYCAFGCDMANEYPGTLFRFPLRTVIQASTSRLSKQSYTPGDMSKLLHELYLEAVEVMLFLKNVEVIEFYEWNTEDAHPRLIYSCQARVPDSKTRLHRQAFLKLAKRVSFSEQRVEIPEQADVFRLDIVTKVVHGYDSGKETVNSFLISQVMGASTSRISALARNAFKSYGMRLVPWASVAANVSGMQASEGRAFCFLPLPLKTGMPFHVNGYFELSANRRDIWYGTDMDRMGKLRSDWNECVLEDVAAACVGHLLTEARKLGAGSAYYSLWPLDDVGDPWRKLAIGFYRNISRMPLLYTQAGRGSWLSPVEALFHDEEYERPEELAEALLAEGLPLTRLAKLPREMIFKHCVGEFKVVTPSMLRTRLEKRRLQVPVVGVYTVLDYCLSDLVDEEAASSLRGLPLVPLQNQTIGRFGLRGKDHDYYLCLIMESNLFQGICERLIDQRLPDSLMVRLKSIASHGQSNIRLVDDTSLDNILRLLLPPEWDNCSPVPWQPGVGRQPSKEWLSLFWSYLSSEQRDLSKLKTWPLVPITTGFLRSPFELPVMLKGGKLSKELESLLPRLGCVFVDPDINPQHPQLLKVVLDPTSLELLDALASLPKLGTSFVSVTGSERRELRCYLCELSLSNKTQLNEARLRTFKTLPIFEAYNDLRGGDFVFVSVENSDTSIGKYLPPLAVDEGLLGSDCLHVRDSEESIVLTQLLGVVRLSKAAFYKRRVLGRIHDIPADSRDVSVIQILRELPQLSIEDSSFVKILKQVPFVPNGAGELKSPQNLYDPENLELLTLLDDQQFFPSGLYSAPDVLPSLRSLGLRTAVFPDTILASSRSVEALLPTDPTKAAERGRVLLSYLDKNAARWLPTSQETGFSWILSKASSLLQTEQDFALSKFWSELATICWCPVLVQPPYSEMPWPAVSQPLAPPRIVRMQSDMWLVSATMRILDGHCDSPGVCERLGWFSKLGGNILAAQLLELGQRDSGEKLAKILATTIPRVYSLLSDMLRSDEMEIVKAMLEDRPWIWAGSGFAASKQVVFYGPSHLAPYLHVVPADMVAFKELFLELGVRQSLDPLGYVSILSKIALEKGGTALDSRELASVVWIVHHLADVNFGSQGTDIMVPDWDGALVPSSQLLYNDAPWLVTSKDVKPGFSGLSNRKLVHAKISNDVAEKVGIASIRKSLLAESADFMDLGLHDGMEAFGQSESLTNRLKHIVEMYTEGPGILFELLQNADDAGASEVSFLLDETTFGTSSILSRQMADWQGAALYCYNNSVFKPEDLRAISSIGQNSKLDKPSAIGRFGLGFNSVYHFTDLPGFVSGTNIVLFDPHAVNLPGVSLSQPGLKINFVGKGLLKQFPDQFEPFLYFGCDLQRPFQGTLFRFPLRTKTTAAKSEIKRESYTPEDVSALFSALKASAEGALLFLRNVTSITVYVRHPMQADMEEIFKAQKETVDYNERELYSFLRGTRQDEQFFKRLENTPDRQLPWSCGKIKLTMTSPGERQCSSWLISTALGGYQAKQLALGNRTRGFVPWAGVAAKLTEDDQPTNHGLLVEDASSLVEGKGFCFLPLPVSTGLPAHVNGYFELSANRRDLWYGTDMVGGGKLKSQWNVALLQDAAAPAYARLLHRAASEVGPCISFHSLWPTQSISEPWKQLSLQVCKAVVDLELPVLYTSARGGKWISAKQAVFPDFTFPEMDKLGTALLEVGLPLVTAPVHVVDMFREVNPSLRFFSPQLLRKLLISSRRTFEKDISILSLQYCMSDVQTPEDEPQLYGLSLVPMVDKSFGTLSTKLAGAKIILADEDEQKLLKSACAHMLADVETESVVFASLKKLALRGTSNVLVITPSVLREVLPVFFPPGWRGKEYVSWTPGEDGHPTFDWMERLWSYIAAHCEDLLEFSSWPLLPTSDGKLLRIQKGGAALADDGWSESMSLVLQKSGCFLVRKDIPVKMREYVQQPTARGVLLAMFTAADGKVSTLLRDCTPAEVRELRQFLFQSKWFTSSGMDTLQLQILRMLPLFQCSTNDFICIAESKELLAPDDMDRLLLGETFIFVEPGKEEDILQTYLGLRKVGKKEYYDSHFPDCLGQLPPEKRMQAFQKAVPDSSLIQGPSLESISRLAFVPTRFGTIEPPDRLYDPRVVELQSLLSKDVFFPSEEFQSNELLDVLVHFGLRRSLGEQGLLDAAKSVAILATDDDAEAARKGAALLAHMNSVVDGPVGTSLDVRFWTELSIVSWCPVLRKPPDPLLPWLPDQDSSVCPPKLVRPATDAWLVSGGMRILDGDCCALLSKKLGWSQTPKASVLANQLVQLSNRHRKLESRTSHLAMEEIAATISENVKRIYELLQSFLRSEDMQVIQTMIEGRPWVWTGDAFVAADDVAFDTPAHFHPYLHVVPLELFGFKELLLTLGVRETFAGSDYVKVLRRLASDTNGNVLSSEQLTFVIRLLEALGEVLPAAEPSVYDSILIPDSRCYLVPAKRLAYNDAPWLIKDASTARLVHPGVDNNLARQLGAVSLRYLSVVNEEMTSSLPCLGMDKIVDILAKFGSAGYLLYDFIEIADCLQARKVHFLYDNVEHPAQSLLQPNLSEFQGPALVVAFENTSLTTEQICALHSSPPVKAHAQTCRYGVGLFSVYQLTDLLLVVSGGCLYMFDPAGRVLSTTVGETDKDSPGIPTGKAYSLQGTGLVERFSDQFHAFRIRENLSLDSPNVTLFRLPLRPKADGSEVTDLFKKFKQHVGNCLLFLKSVAEVTVSERIGLATESVRELFSVSVGSSFAALRHPFHERNWRKFQLSNLFGSSNASTKTHTIDVFVKDEDGTIKVVKWLVVQSLASGQTRDMALDRRYLHYQLAPIAGVAACISMDGVAEVAASQSCVLAPLPVPLEFEIPVTIFGNFLPFAVGGRHFFLESLGEYPVKVGMLGSHAGPSISDEIIRATWNRQLLSCVVDSYVDLLQELHHSNLSQTANTYSLWPKSLRNEPASSNDARCLVKWLVRPMYKRLGDMPLWQLHGGSMVTFSQGLFVAPASQGVPPKPSVCEFLKSHYPILIVPWELGKEVEAATGNLMKQLTSKTLRSIIKGPSFAAVAQSLTTQIDLLEYCCADAAPGVFHVDGTLTDVVDIDTTVLADLKGVACPTANEFMLKLGTLELWIATREQQSLLPGLGKKFLHPLCLERPLLAVLFHNRDFQLYMNVKRFSAEILAANIWTAFPRDWARSRSTWVVWSEEQPSAEFIHNFWKFLETFRPVDTMSLFGSSPLIPATIGPTSILVRVCNRSQVFVLPEVEHAEVKYPWLIPVLGKLGVPVFNMEFSDCLVVVDSFGQTDRNSLTFSLVSTLASLKESGFWNLSASVLAPDDCNQLFVYLAEAAANDFDGLSSYLTPRELSALRSLPIYQTVRGKYTEVEPSLHFLVAPGAFMQPDDYFRLQYCSAARGGRLYELLEVPELKDHELLARCALPNYGSLSSSDRERVLTHIYYNWNTLTSEAAVLTALRNTKFVVNETSSELYTPGELVDPENTILKQIFVAEQWRFPGKEFATRRWLQILRTVGLGSIRDPALVLECARKVEELGRQDLASTSLLTTNGSTISDAVWSLAEALTEEILNDVGSVYSKSFCDELSSIAFVPAEKGIPTTAGGAPTRALTSYRHAALLKDWALSWTCCPLLTRPNLVPPAFSWRNLHLRSPPSMTVVITHLQTVGQNGGEDVLSRWPNTKDSKSAEDVFGEVLAYLNSVWNELSTTDKQQLSQHSFIPVANGTRLVTASSLYTKLGMDLAPFVFEVPRAYLSYVNILSELGMRYEPGALDMIDLLLRLQEACGYQRLNPNELQAVFSILRFICESSGGLRNDADIVVPDENARLVRATSCAYVDAGGAQLVSRIDVNMVKFVHPTLAEEICLAVGVKRLAEIISEELDDEAGLVFVDSLRDYPLSLAREQLASDAFGQAVWTVLAGEFLGRMKLSKVQVSEALTCASQTLRFVKTLQTKLLLSETRKDVTKRGQRTYYFFNRAKTLILAAEPPEFLSVPELLAVLVSRLLGLTTCLPLAPLFNIPVNQMKSLEQAMQLMAGGLGDAKRHGALTALVGETVLPVDAKSLQFCPLRPFYAGEIVGWHHEGRPAELSYGRVVEDIRAPAGQPLYRIRVETSPGTTQVLLSSNVLSFKGTGNVTSASEHQVETETTVPVEESTTTSVDGVEEVGAAGYVRAVTDILSSLGVPPSLETQSLLEQTIHLQEQLNLTKASLEKEKGRADTALEEVEKVRSGWTCRICLAAEVNSLLIPCGHVLCHRCSSSVSRCPFCRQGVNSSHTIYRP